MKNRSDCSSTNSKLRCKNIWRGCSLALAILLILAGTAHSQQQCTPDPTNCTPQFKFDGLKININTCDTTQVAGSQCAWADVTQGAKNFLACSLTETGPIALCFYSGVKGDPDHTLPCTLSQDGNAADCECYVIESTFSPEYSYVDINGILNEDVYNTTMQNCTTDGSGCLNMSDLNSGLPEAPVCAAIANKTFYTHLGKGKNKVIISDYSDVLINNPFREVSTDCGTTVYAGCMTAPCEATGKTDPTTGLPIALCKCPTYNGPNQVGSPQLPDGSYSCSPTPNVWSSRYMPPM